MSVSNDLGWQQSDNFNELVERYAGNVFGLAYHMLGDAAEAEDAAQEAFLRAYTRLSNFDPARASFKTWLLAITSNHCIDRLRKRHMPSLSLDGPLSFDPALVSRELGYEQTAIVGERNALVRSLLADLAPRHRAAIVLRYWYDMSYREIAEVLETNVSVVKSLLFRARTRLAGMVLVDDDPESTYDGISSTFECQPLMSCIDLQM